MYQTLALAALCVLVVAQDTPDCGEVYRTGTQCLRGKVKESFDASPWAKIDEEKIHGGIKQCFVTAGEAGGCKDIGMELLDNYKEAMQSVYKDFMQEGSETSERIAPIAEVMGIEPEQFQKLMFNGMKCGMKLIPTIKKSVEACIQMTKPELKTFTLPSLPEPILSMPEIPAELLETVPEEARDTVKEGIKMAMGEWLMMASMGCPVRQFMIESIFTHMMEQHLKGEFARILYAKDTCKTKEAADSVAECVGKAVADGLPKELSCSHGMRNHLAFYSQVRGMCDAKDECFKDAAPVCGDLWYEMPKMLCACGTAFVDGFWDEITSNLTQCVNAEMGPDNEIQLPPILTRGTFKKQKCQMVDMPPPPEPCDAEFDIEHMIHHAKKIMGMHRSPCHRSPHGSGSCEPGEHWGPKGKGKGNGGPMSMLLSKGKGMPPLPFPGKRESKEAVKELVDVVSAVSS